MAPFLIRSAQAKDLSGLYALAAHLNSVNFPHDRTALRAAIQRSQKSFKGETRHKANREFLFVLEQKKQILGASMIFAQHGTRSAPHIYFDVLQDERYSTTLDAHFRHPILQIGFNFDGPTEIGALVLAPRARGKGLGRPLALMRFAFIAMFRRYFRDEVIAELMPPLTADGHSPLWEHLGRRFTSMGYQKADKLSQHNKEFVLSLFPQGPIHAALLPDAVQDVIGKVGPGAQAIQRMLSQEGFTYSNRIDPFDGGPHYQAPTDSIKTVAQTKKYRVATDALPAASTHAPQGFVCAAHAKPPINFRGTTAPAEPSGKTLRLSSDVRKRLSLRAGDTVWFTAA